GDECPITFDIHVDVAVEVRDVEESLDVIRGDVSLILQGLDVDTGLRRFSHRYSTALFLATSHSDPVSSLPLYASGALSPAYPQARAVDTACGRSEPSADVLHHAP